jgi:hypothetical protein
MAAKEKNVVIPYDPEILRRIGAQWEAERLTPEQRAAKAELLRAIDQVDEHLGLKPPPSVKTATNGPLFDAAGGKLFIKKWHKLSQGEKDVLRLLVCQGAAAIKELREVHGSPHKVLKTLCKKYPALKKHITFPGGPCRGGYSTTIKPV